MVDFKNVLSFDVFERVQKALTKPALITLENNPELIQAVTDEMRNSQQEMILSRLQDLERAVYHVAGKQQELMDNQKGMEELMVSTATSVDEILNGLEEAIEETFEVEAESDDDLPDSFWEGKKASNSLN